MRKRHSTDPVFMGRAETGDLERHGALESRHCGAAGGVTVRSEPRRAIQRGVPQRCRLSKEHCEAMSSRSGAGLGPGLQVALGHCHLS